MESLKIIGKVIKVTGECVAGHCEGEEFDLTLYSHETGEVQRITGVCPFLYNAIFPYLVTLQFGGCFPWEKDRNVFLAGCPDNLKVIIEMRRLKNQPK